MSIVPRKFYLDSIFDNLISEEKLQPMKCDIYEKDNQYHIEADIPGFKKDEISVTCDDGYLTITAEKQQEAENSDKNYIKKERIYGKIERQFYIGNVDMENITADFNDGMLKIVVPREDETKNQKQIEIK